VIIITYFSIVIGELVPKRIGQLQPELIARLVAVPMQLLAVATKPFVWALAVSTHALLRFLGVRQVASSTVTVEDIQAMVAEGAEAGAVVASQNLMVRNIFRLDERKVGAMMIPRSDIVYLDLALPWDENLQRVTGSSHSRFPVCRGGLDNVVGVIHVKQLFLASQGQDPAVLESLLQPAVYVPETLGGLSLLESFQSSDNQMALVVDEYGELEGLITLHDLLEAVTGEFSAPGDDEPSAFQRPDGSWLLDGALPVLELKDCLQLRSVPDEGRRRYHTLSGMLMLLLDRVPATGDRVSWLNWQFEVVDMDGQRLDKVLATPHISPAQDSDD